MVNQLLQLAQLVNMSQVQEHPVQLVPLVQLVTKYHALLAQLILRPVLPALMVPHNAVRHQSLSAPINAPSVTMYRTQSVLSVLKGPSALTLLQQLLVPLKPTQAKDSLSVLAALPAMTVPFLRNSVRSPDAQREATPT